jgi:c-di-GMP-binding flagellar brake protein YcgR
MLAKKVHYLNRQVEIETVSSVNAVRDASTILNMDEETIVLAAPVMHGKSVLLRPGTEVVIHERNAEGKRLSYRTIAITQERDSETGAWVWIVAQSEGTPIPGRAFYRELIEASAHVTVTKTDETLVATAIDLSGSGVQLALQKNLSGINSGIGVRVQLQLADLGFNQSFDLPGTIVRSWKDKFQGLVRTYLAIQFDAFQLDSGTQDDIIRYCIKHHLHQRRMCAVAA